MLSVRIAWLTICLLWIAAEIRLARKSTIAQQQAASSERRSQMWLWLSVMASVSLALIAKNLAWLPIAIEYLPRQWLAMTVFAGGLGLRYWAVQTLGRFFSTHVLIQHQHQLITQGPYQWIRHPTYSGVLVAFLGAGLAMGDMLALLLISGLPFLAFNARITIEETAMLKAFGDDYQSYMQRSHKLLPGIY